MAKKLYRLYWKVDKCLMIIELNCYIADTFIFRYNSWFPGKLLIEIRTPLNIYNILKEKISIII